MGGLALVREKHHRKSQRRNIALERELFLATLLKRQVVKGLPNMTHFTTANKRVVARRLAQTSVESKREFYFELRFSKTSNSSNIYPYIRYI